MEGCKLTCFVYSRDLLRAVWSFVTLLRMADRAEVGLHARYKEKRQKLWRLELSGAPASVAVGRSATTCNGAVDLMAQINTKMRL